MHDAINWFEITVQDFDRAIAFYERVFDVKLKREEFGGEMPMAVFPTHPDGVGGALVVDRARRSGDGGTRAYLNANGQLDAILTRVRAAGGQVLVPKVDIGDPGFIAVMTDTEGNVVGLHQPR